VLPAPESYKFFSGKEETSMIKVGIIGATGYAGNELVRLLMGHKEAEIVWYGSRSYIDQNYADVYQNMFEIVDAACLDDNMAALAAQADVIFTATPQGFLAGVLTEDILNKVKIIDLSADFRIKDVKTYEAWYKIEHKSPQFIKEAVYGLCEINRGRINQNTRLIANPGCYTTCSILTAYPLVKEGLIDPDTLIIDAKSGTSGAGRGAKLPNLFCEVNENMKAYGVTNHRHTPEIEEQLGYAAGHPITVNFTPHLVPMNRGILATEYATLKRRPDGSLPSYEEIKAAYDKYYAKEKFVRVLKKDVCPETKWVEGSNYVDVNFTIDARTGRIVMMGALDNLVKGAAGQAVQNMNLLFGLDEAEGLRLVPMFP
jgi:N-acetyl-gamma-glutamyl-phosphate reductase